MTGKKLLVIMKNRGKKIIDLVTYIPHLRGLNVVLVYDIHKLQCIIQMHF